MNPRSFFGSSIAAIASATELTDQMHSEKKFAVFPHSLRSENRFSMQTVLIQGVRFRCCAPSANGPVTFTICRSKKKRGKA
jgi:hypothetical protein